MKEDPDKFELYIQHEVQKKTELFNESHSPSIIMCNPKYPHNVGGAVRAASCFGAKLVLFTGKRVSLDPNGVKGYRLPREERMKGYKHVKILNDEYPFNRFSKDIVPVAVEVRDNSEELPYFQHPKNAVYVFGPEDGNIPQVMLRHCHRFIKIPTYENYCTNLAAAIYLVLYDRDAKLRLSQQGTFLNNMVWGT